MLMPLIHLQVSHYKSKNDLELELQEDVFWGSKLCVFSKTEFKENVVIL